MSARPDAPPRGAEPARDYDYAYYRAALSDARLPAAFVDLDQFDANLELLRRRAGGLPIRIVTKSVRSVAILRRLVAAGPFVRGLLCYAPAEAAWLAAQGFDDLVVAYPAVEPADLRAVAVQVRAGRAITLMVDDPAQVRAAAAAAQAEGVEMALALDLDMSSDFPGLRFGVYRSPVDGPAAALALAAAIAATPGVRLDGLMGYESQIAGLMDDVPGKRLKNAVVRLLKRRSVVEVNARRQATVAALAAGSGLYVPTLFDHYRAFHARPAAGFALAVTRVPGPGFVTCAGGGYPASGPAGADRLPRPWLPAGCSLLANEGAGEVQTPVRVPVSAALAIGAPLLFRHAKAGELCERFDELLLIAGGQVVDRVATYRGDGRCFF